MNGFISALAAQSAPQPVSPVVDGSTSRPVLPAADDAASSRGWARVRRDGNELLNSFAAGSAA